MTRDEILQMARSAGFDYDEGDKEIIVGYYGDNVTPQLERFAHLVEQRTREECARVIQESDSFCPSCGHNRDASSVSSISNEDGTQSCQICGASWREF